MEDHAEHEQVEQGFATFPRGAAQAEQKFSCWEQRQQEREEDLLGQLFIPNSTFGTTLFGIMQTLPWQMGAQGTEVERLSSDHGLHHVHQASERFNSPVWGQGFETAQDFARLETGRFWSRHTPRTLPFLLPDRKKDNPSEFPHWERLDKDVRY